MHYSFHFTDKLLQFDLHFEPNPVFTNRLNNELFFPENDTDNIIQSKKCDYPFINNMIYSMLTYFDCLDLIRENKVILIIRNHNSHSANWGQLTNNKFEKCLMQEFEELGCQSLIIDDSQILSIKNYPNSGYAELI